MSKKEFNNFRFEGFNVVDKSNQYWTIGRVNNTETKIIIKVDGSHLFTTKYGYGMKLDATHTLFLKEWQVSSNYFGNEVVLDRNYFEVKTWGDWSNDFENNEEALNFDFYVNIAKEQEANGNKVLWAK